MLMPILDLSYHGLQILGDRFLAFTGVIEQLKSALVRSGLPITTGSCGSFPRLSLSSDDIHPGNYMLQFLNVVSFEHFNKRVETFKT
jgi:hypothetical protein